MTTVHCALPPSPWVFSRWRTGIQPSRESSCRGCRPRCRAAVLACASRPVAVAIVSVSVAPATSSLPNSPTSETFHSFSFSSYIIRASLIIHFCEIVSEEYRNRWIILCWLNEVKVSLLYSALYKICTYELSVKRKKTWAHRKNQLVTVQSCTRITLRSFHFSSYFSTNDLSLRSSDTIREAILLLQFSNLWNCWPRSRAHRWAPCRFWCARGRICRMPLSAASDCNRLS